MFLWGGGSVQEDTPWTETPSPYGKERAVRVLLEYIKFGFNYVTEMLLVWPIHLHKHDHEEFSVGSPWGLFTQVGISKREKVVTDVPPRSVLTVFSFCFAVTQLYVFM